MCNRPLAVGRVSYVIGHIGVQRGVLAMMVNFCNCIGCWNRLSRNKDKSFFRLPAGIHNQGEQTKALSEKRQRVWLVAIKRQNIKAGTSSIPEYVLITLSEADLVYL